MFISENKQQLATEFNFDVWDKTLISNGSGHPNHYLTYSDYIILFLCLMDVVAYIKVIDHTKC